MPDSQSVIWGLMKSPVFKCRSNWLVCNEGNNDMKSWNTIICVAIKTDQQLHAITEDHFTRAGARKKWGNFLLRDDPLNMMNTLATLNYLKQFKTCLNIFFVFFKQNKVLCWRNVLVRKFLLNYSRLSCNTYVILDVTIISLMWKDWSISN